MCEDIFFEMFVDFYRISRRYVQECSNLNSYQRLYTAEVVVLQCLMWLFGGL